MTDHGRSGKNPRSGATETFAPERTHVFAAVLMILIMLIPVVNVPLALVWFLAIPVAYLWWIVRARTTVGEDGIATRYALRPGRHVTWDEFAGLEFVGAKAQAVTEAGQRVPMPAVSFNSLPTLSRASGGRIPDALTAGLEHLDGKVTVVGRDGEETLLTKEEYEERLRRRRESGRKAGGDGD